MTEATLRDAAARIATRVRRTALFEVPRERLPAGVRLLLKRECDQVAGSFKARGAHHFIARALADSAPVRGVVTYSSGNHGRAVAEAAASHELPALITVPESIDGQKARAIDAAGVRGARSLPPVAFR